MEKFTDSAGRSWSESELLERLVRGNRQEAKRLLGLARPPGPRFGIQVELAGEDAAGEPVLRVSAAEPFAV